MLFQKIIPHVAADSRLTTNERMHRKSYYHVATTTLSSQLTITSGEKAHIQIFVEAAWTNEVDAVRQVMDNYSTLTREKR